ncbi:septum formation initiator family protein [Sphingomonas sp. ASV193]|uniref:FtsB family cell division protein n=1 Tax=Sphingomonas sp. ASV193 TaxID=3144405 RepID=UPI0032E8BF18
MGKTANKSIQLMRRAMWPVLALVIVGNFATYAVAGPNGLLAWGGYSRQLHARKAELAQLQAQKAELKHRSALLDPRKADPDLADELVRRDLGLVRSDEVTVPLN